MIKFYEANEAAGSNSANSASPYALLELFDADFAAFNADYMAAINSISAVISDLNSLLKLDDSEFDARVSDALVRASEVGAYVEKVAAREVAAKTLVTSIAKALDVDTNASLESVTEQVSKNLGISDLASDEAKQKIASALSSNAALAQVKTEAKQAASKDIEAAKASIELKAKASVAANIAKASAKLNNAKDEASKEAAANELKDLKDSADANIAAEASKENDKLGDISAANQPAITPPATQPSSEPSLMSHYVIGTDHFYKIGDLDEFIIIKLAAEFNGDLLNTKLSELENASFMGLKVQAKDEAIELLDSSNKVFMKTTDVTLKELSQAINFDVKNAFSIKEVLGNVMQDANTLKIGEHIVKFEDFEPIKLLGEDAANPTVAKLLQAGATSIDGIDIRSGVLDIAGVKIAGLKNSLSLNDIAALASKEALTWGDIKALLDTSYKVAYVNGAKLLVSGSEFQLNGEAIADNKALSEFASTNDKSGTIPDAAYKSIIAPNYAATKSGTKTITVSCDESTTVDDLIHDEQGKNYLKYGFSDNSNNAYEKVKIVVGEKSLEIGKDTYGYYATFNKAKIHINEEKASLKALLTATTVKDLKELGSYAPDYDFFNALKDSAKLADLPASIKAAPLSTVKDLLDAKYVVNRDGINFKADATFNDYLEAKQDFKSIKEHKVDTYKGFKIDAANNTATKNNIKLTLADSAILDFLNGKGPKEFSDLKLLGVTSINDTNIDSVTNIDGFNKLVFFDEQTPLSEFSGTYVTDSTLGNLGEIMAAYISELEEDSIIRLGSFSFKQDATVAELKALITALKGSDKAATLAAIKTISGNEDIKSIVASDTTLVKDAVHEDGTYYVFNASNKFLGILEQGTNENNSYCFYNPLGASKVGLNPNAAMNALPTKDTKFSELKALGYTNLFDLSITNESKTLADALNNDFKGLKALGEFKIIDDLDDAKPAYGTVKYEANKLSFSPNKELDIFKTGGAFENMGDIELIEGSAYSLVSLFKGEHTWLELKTANLPKINISSNEGELNIAFRDKYFTDIFMKAPINKLANILSASSINDALAYASEAKLSNYVLLAKNSKLNIIDPSSTLQIKGDLKASINNEDWFNLAQNITVDNLKAVASNVIISKDNKSYDIANFKGTTSLWDVVEDAISHSTKGTFDIEPNGDITLDASGKYVLNVNMQPEHFGVLDIKNFTADDKLVLHFSSLNGKLYDLAQTDFIGETLSKYSGEDLQEDSGFNEAGTLMAHEYVSGSEHTLNILGMNSASIGDEEYINIKGIANAHYEISGNDLIITSAAE